MTGLQFVLPDGRPLWLERGEVTGSEGLLRLAQLAVSIRGYGMPSTRDAAGRYSRPGIALGGTISGEHGVGRKTIAVGGQTVPYLQAMYGEAGLQQIAATRRALDPQWLLNPRNTMARVPVLWARQRWHGIAER